MSTTPLTSSFLFSHTFGRDHMDPPPMPSTVQMGQKANGGQMGEDTAQNLQMHAGGLPHDFDHIVRSVGEW